MRRSPGCYYIYNKLNHPSQLFLNYKMYHFLWKMRVREDGRAVKALCLGLLVTPESRSGKPRGETASHFSTWKWYYWEIEYADLWLIGFESHSSHGFFFRGISFCWGCWSRGISGFGGYGGFRGMCRWRGVEGSCGIGSMIAMEWEIAEMDAVSTRSTGRRSENLFSKRKF